MISCQYLFSEKKRKKKRKKEKRKKKKEKRLQMKAISFPTGLFPEEKKSLKSYDIAIHEVELFKQVFELFLGGKTIFCPPNCLRGPYTLDLQIEEFVNFF